MLKFIQDIESGLKDKEGALDKDSFITEAAYVEIAVNLQSTDEKEVKALYDDFSSALANLNDVDQSEIKEYAEKNKGLLTQIYPVLRLFEAKGKKRR